MGTGVTLPTKSPENRTTIAMGPTKNLSADSGRFSFFYARMQSREPQHGRFHSVEENNLGGSSFFANSVNRGALMYKNLFVIFALTISLIFVNGARAETRPSTSVPEGGLSTPAEFSAYTQKTREIIFEPSRNYDHKSGWFSIAVPGNWNVTDKSLEGEVIVSIADPTENGIVVVRVNQSIKRYTPSELGEMLKAFLNERMAGFDGFTMGELKSQRNGSLGLYFNYNSLVEGTNYKMHGDAFIEQHNGRIGVVTLLMPQDQYEAKQKSAYELMNSFRLTGKTP
jgi:hypothetical protein